MLHFVSVLIFKILFGRTLKPFGLFFWKSVVHLLLLFLFTHDLRGVVLINSQVLIFSTLFFPKFHRKVVVGCSVVGRGKKEDVVEEKWLGLRRWLRKKNNGSWQLQAKKHILFFSLIWSIIPGKKKWLQLLFFWKALFC